MRREWPLLRIGDLADSISKTHDFGKKELIFLNTSDVLRGKILHRRYSPIKAWPGQAKKSIKRGDILFSEIRPANGRYAYVDIDADDYVVSTKLMVIRAKEQVIPKFLYHYVTSKQVTAWLQHLAESRSGTFPQITFDLVAELELNLPPKHIQNAIVAFIDSFDEKIELNRRLNETLEAASRTLFKSWFVDFDPVRARMTRRKPTTCNELMQLFAASFEETELGPAPTGWRIARVEALCSRIAMGPFGSDIKTDNFVDAGVPVIRGANLTNGFIDDGFVYITDGKADELRNANAYPDDIVITHRGTLGQVGIVPLQSRFARYVVSQSQLVLSVDLNVATPLFLFEFLRSDKGQQQLLSNISQTRVPAIARPVTAIKAMTLILPPLKLMRAFQQVAQPLAAKMVANNNESSTLTTLRNILLPKLLSGEIRLDEAEKMIGAAV
jgi:type I restriction enzyme, S subunit